MEHHTSTFYNKNVRRLVVECQGISISLRGVIPDSTYAVVAATNSAASSTGNLYIRSKES
jgi:hypothetical protein